MQGKGNLRARARFSLRLELHQMRWASVSPCLKSTFSDSLSKHLLSALCGPGTGVAVPGESQAWKRSQASVLCVCGSSTGPRVLRGPR